MPEKTPELLVLLISVKVQRSKDEKQLFLYALVKE